MYDIMHYPCAKATIDKGKFLDHPEMKAAMAAAQTTMSNGSKQEEGKKEGKKKGKKGR